MMLALAKMYYNLADFEVGWILKCGAEIVPSYLFPSASFSQIILLFADLYEHPSISLEDALVRPPFLL